MSASLERRFELNANAPAGARAFLRSALPFWCGEQAERAMLLTSELVTNAVVHAHSECTVRLVMQPATLRVEVADTDPTPPHVTVPRGPDGGYGLRLVEALAGDWGVDVVPTGKTVWFSVDCD